MEVQYLNTDLEIESAEDLTRIVEEFGENVNLLYHGMAKTYHTASFEVGGVYDSADDAANYFCLLVEQLPKDVRSIWDKCVSRVFDIGFESGESPSSYRTELRTSTIQRIAKIGASVVITIYGSRSSDENKSNA